MSQFGELRELGKLNFWKYHRQGPWDLDWRRSSQPLSNFVIFWKKVAILTPFGSQFTPFESHLEQLNQRWSRGHKARGQGHKKIRGQSQGQGQPFRGQTLSRPRTGMLEAKAKHQGHKRKCSPKQKKRSSQKFFK